MSFLFFDNLAIVSRTTPLMQAITSINHAFVCIGVYGYLTLSFISMCVTLSVLVTYLIYYWLYILSSCLLQLKHD